jgi:hypothetical protein
VIRRDSDRDLPARPRNPNLSRENIGCGEDTLSSQFRQTADVFLFRSAPQGTARARAHWHIGAASPHPARSVGVALSPDPALHRAGVPLALTPRGGPRANLQHRRPAGSAPIKNVTADVERSRKLPRLQVQFHTPCSEFSILSRQRFLHLTESGGEVRRTS